MVRIRERFSRERPPTTLGGGAPRPGINPAFRYREGPQLSFSTRSSRYVPTMHTRAWLSIGFGVVLAFLSAVPSAARTHPANGMLPDGDVRPVVHSVLLMDPQRHNALLEADLVVRATDNDGIARYEYRWNSSTFGSTQATEVISPTVDYSLTTPETPYALELRAIDVHANASDWFPVWSGTTPSAPTVIVAGDSIASGYTRQWFTGNSRCRDASLSYGSVVASGVAAGLPDAWAPEYHNIAWAGAGIRAMLSGGDDSCGESHEAQVTQIQRLVDGMSWNVVVITAGINSTNWTDVIVGLTRDTAISVTRDGDRRACDVALSDRWNIDRRAPIIEAGTRETAQLLTSTTNASVFWTGYYDVTGTRLAPLWAPIGGECSNEMSEALGSLHGALRAGLTSEITWVDIDRDIATQSWAGWPHPNSSGHRAIGALVIAAITQGGWTSHQF